MKLYIFYFMDLNHDYNGTNEFLVTSSTERLQVCKCVIMAFGDLGYTDPSIPDIRDALGGYTDSDGISNIRQKIYEILLMSQVVREDEIISIDVISEQGADHYIVDLQLTFGSERFEMQAME